jgi:hypothetical protein
LLSDLQGDSRIVSDLAPLFLQHKLLSHRILHCLSVWIKFCDHSNPISEKWNNSVNQKCQNNYIFVNKSDYSWITLYTQCYLIAGHWINFKFAYHYCSLCKIFFKTIPDYNLLDYTTQINVKHCQKLKLYHKHKF